MADEFKLPVFTDEMVERRRSVLTEGYWIGKLGSTVNILYNTEDYRI